MPTTSRSRGSASRRYAIGSRSHRCTTSSPRSMVWSTSSRHTSCFSPSTARSSTRFARRAWSTSSSCPTCSCAGCGWARARRGSRARRAELLLFDRYVAFAIGDSLERLAQRGFGEPLDLPARGQLYHLRETSIVEDVASFLLELVVGEVILVFVHVDVRVEGVVEAHRLVAGGDAVEVLAEVA